ncbi:protein of unknown function [Prevotella sp. KH2C16]|nr:DUF4112 domain-containing protein [Prevotella sp. KH2C16]SFG16542.1 protein of unknown function [Prevotella sp. KH2C16]
MTTAERKKRLGESRLYQGMQKISAWLDRYYLDAIAGLVPGGIGDVATALFSLVHVYFALFRLRSVPLTLAILNNALRDVLFGLIPFYVGDVLDFFHRANSRNMALINGFLNNDETVIRNINRKALQSLAMIVVFVLAIFAMLYVLMKIASALGTVIFS